MQNREYIEKIKAEYAIVHKTSDWYESFPDVEINPEDPQEQKVEKVSIKKALQAEDGDDGPPTETEFNSIPAPDLQNIKIESKIPPHKSKQFSQIYKLWNQDLNPTLKESTSV